MKQPSESEFRADTLERICTEYGVDLLYAFGSRADEVYGALSADGRIDPQAPSDVDLGVKALPGHGLDVRRKVELAMAFEDLLGVDRVDLAGLADVDPFVAVEVIRGNRLYCADECRADEYELFVLRRAGDLAPFERERIKMVLGTSP